VGDTLWASGHELYDRISEPYQKFLESLTATYVQPKFNKIANKNHFSIHAGSHDAPENVGTDLSAIQPVVRTTSVTGWKSVFAVGHHVQHILGLTPFEGRQLLDNFVKLITENHDLQFRHRWQNPNDLGEYSDISTV
jgi:alpha-ketoglutarate-dependent taurine dioxygenase